MHALLQDLRQTLRSLAKAPGFTAIAVLTIALGIGANTAIYTLVDHVLFRPLPFLNSDRLVAVWETAPGGNDHNEFAPANFMDLRASAKTMDHVVAHAWTNANLTGGDRPERVQGFAVSSDFFDALELTPMLGRGFRKGEDVRGSDAFVVLTHALWTRRFGADRNIVGTSIMVNGRARQVVGVLPEGIAYPSPAELYVPLAPTPETLASRQAHYLLVTGRLAPGATPEQARAEVSAIMARLAKQYPETNAKWAANTRPFLPDLTRQLQPVMLVLLAAVGFVLLIACANMANLMLARGVSRQRELFVRAALGATRWRLAQRVLVESVVIAIVGGIAGVAVGTLGLRGLIAIVPREHARFLAGFDRIAVDGNVLLVTSAVVLLLSLLVSVLPAVRAARSAALDSGMRSGGRGSTGRHRVRATLVGVEVGLAIMLLVGAGLTVRTFAFLSQRATGVDASRTALASLTLPTLRYREPDAQREFFRAVLAETRALPGVAVAGASSIIPMCQCNNTTSFQIDGAVPFAQGEEPDVGERTITPGYLESLAIGLKRGRMLGDADRAGAPRVVMVNEALERRYFPAGALGRRLVMSDSISFEIVGVVTDIRHGGPIADPQPEMYLPFEQNPTQDMTITVRANGVPAESLLPALRRVVSAVDAELPLYDVRTMRQVSLLAIGPVRLSVTLLTVLATLALSLAMIGIYGVASQLVAERTREIGIRMALGSAQANVVRFILARGLRAVTIGAVVGLAAAGLLSKGLAHQLVGVRPLDPVTYLTVALVLFGAALLAIYSPARRVSRIDPMVVLRTEDS